MSKKNHQIYSNKKTQNLIKRFLRQATVRWNTRGECLKNAEVYIQIGRYKNGKPKYKKHHTCAACGGDFPTGKSGGPMVVVDHIVEIGSIGDSWDAYLSRMFCDLDGLQCLCPHCHDKKTAEYKEWRETGAQYL